MWLSFYFQPSQMLSCFNVSGPPEGSPYTWWSPQWNKPNIAIGTRNKNQAHRPQWSSASRWLGPESPHWCFWAGRVGRKFTHRSDLWSCKLEIQMYKLGTYPNSFLGKVKSSAHSCTMRNVFYFCTSNCQGPSGEPGKQLIQSQNKAWLNLNTWLSSG